MNNFFPLASQQARLSSDADNTQARNLYEQVIRKNQQIAKTMLSKMAELYTRQQQYENSLADLNQRMKQMAESTKNLHHEMRSTHLEIERKQEILVDDIKKVKTGIKMPQAHASHQQYLSSNFFKEHTTMINGRARNRRHIRNKTNIIGKVATFDVPDFQEEECRRGTVDIYRQRSTANLSQAFSIPQMEYQGTIQQKKSINISTHLIRSKDSSDQLEKVLFQVRDMNSELEQVISKVAVDMTSKHTQIDQKMQLMRQQMKDKLEKMSKDIVRENQLGQIDFQGLHTYLDKKVKDSLADTINKKYFEQTLINLQDAVESELNRIYLLLEQKLGKVDMILIDDRIGELRQQIEGWTNLNSLKIQNLSYNSTCKSTPFKVNLQRSSIEQCDSNNRIPRQTAQESRIKRQPQLRYCNSTSAIQRTDDRKELRLDEVNEQKWKKRVVFALGTNKQHKIRRERA